MTDPDTSDGANPSQIGYADALAELDEILGELEADDVDIDVLSDRVARAAELITVCRGRIRHAHDQVADIMRDFDSPDAIADAE